jgi:hypothetical protein
VSDFRSDLRLLVRAILEPNPDSKIVQRNRVFITGELSSILKLRTGKDNYGQWLGRLLVTDP